jgi:hypothetical protein
MSNQFWLGVTCSIACIALGEFLFILYLKWNERKNLADSISDQAFRNVQGKSDEELKDSIRNHLHGDD